MGGVTPVQHLKRLSEYLQRDIYIKRDDVSHLGMGGNKLRKLEFLAADALNKGCDTLVTAGQFNQPRTPDCGSRRTSWVKMRGVAGQPDSNRRI